MASFTVSSSVNISLALFLLFFTTIAPSSSHLSPVKCMHHHARLVTCARFLEDEVPLPHQEKKQLSHPTEACCKNYEEIFRSGTPTCLCRYLHPEKLKTSFNVTKLMSLHDVCPSSITVPLYDLCVGLDGPEGMFNGIIEVVDRDRVDQRRLHPSMQI